VAIQSINSKLYLISKYQNPNTKACLEININTIDEIEIAIMPFPLAYQHIKAINGEIQAIIIQIIIYDLGKKPATKTVYK
jgi:hypothetical protein